MTLKAAMYVLIKEQVSTLSKRERRMKKTLC